VEAYSRRREAEIKLQQVLLQTVESLSMMVENVIPIPPAIRKRFAS
jgi:hypothetical protein